MCMSMMISMMELLAWAGISLHGARHPEVHPPAASEETGIPVQKEPRRLQNPHPGKVVSGVRAALHPKDPASREAVPPGNRTPARPAEDQQPRRPDQAEAIPPQQKALPQRRRIPHPNSGVPVRPGRNSTWPLRPLICLRPKGAGALHPPSTGGPLTVPQEQGAALTGPQAHVQSGRLPAKPGRNPASVQPLPRLRQEAAGQWLRPVRQEPDALLMQEAPAVPGTEAPARPGRNCPEARSPEVRFKEAAHPASTPAWQEQADARLNAQLPK